MQNEPTYSRLTKGRYQLQYRGTECLNFWQALYKSDSFPFNCPETYSTKKLTPVHFCIGFFTSLATYDSKPLKALFALLLSLSKIFNGYINRKKRLDTYSLSARFDLKRAYSHMLIRANEDSNLAELGREYDSRLSQIDSITFNAADGYLSFFKLPGSLTESLITKLPFLFFSFLSVFALFNWPVNNRETLDYTDYSIFSFHIQSLLFILLIIRLPVNTIFKVHSGLIFVLLFMVYLLKPLKMQLKRPI